MLIARSAYSFPFLTGTFVTTLFVFNSSSWSSNCWSAVAQTQIVPDFTSGSLITTEGRMTTITGGTRSGDTLFHSFDQFSIAADATAKFSYASDLSTILTRVTGSQSSLVDGLFSAPGTADFFLINPNGIRFGSSAQLDVGGSFIASSADSIVFENGFEFSAVDSQPVSLLTISTPVGLQYGKMPADVDVLGNGNGFEIDPDTLEVVFDNSRSGLQVDSSKTLGLLGGAVALNGGNLTAPGGRILLGSVGDRSLVSLEQDRFGWRADFSGVSAFADLGLFNASSIVTSGSSSGDVQIAGRSVEILEGSAVLSSIQDTGTSGGVSIQATQEIILAGAQIEASTNEAFFPTSVFAEVAPTATAVGGNVTFVSPYLFIGDGAQVSTSVFGTGDGGSIGITASLVEIVGGTQEIGPSGFFLQVIDPFSLGEGGDFNLQADELLLSEGAVIDSTTFGPGNAGDINIQAERISLLNGLAGLGSSRIVSQVEDSGNGGSISITGDHLSILGGAAISSEVFGSGSGGSISVDVEEIVVEGLSPGGLASRLSSKSEIGSSGDSGSINLQANQLTVANGAEIRSSTLSSGNAGRLNIQATSVNLVGRTEGSTGVFSVVDFDATGEGGQLSILTDELTVQNGAQVGVVTLGSGTAGNLKVVADTVTLDGQNSNGSSGLFSNALSSTGAGGTITINADELVIQDGATINASNFPSFEDSSIAPGQGAAGSIDIAVETAQLLDDALITTSTLTGDLGNVDLTSDLLLLRDQSVISTDAAGQATGGNITLNTQFLVAPPTENSDITANAVRGQGGNISISVQRILGTQFRETLTDESDITASSEFGVDGTVDIQIEGLDLANTITALPADLSNSDDLFVAGCPADTGANFIATGRGGLPLDPTQGLSEESLFPAFERPSEQILGPSTRIAATTALPQVIENPQRPIVNALNPMVEASGWQQNAKGEVQLFTQGNAESLLSAQRSLADCLRGAPA